MDGQEVWLGLLSYLRRLEGRRSVKDTIHGQFLCMCVRVHIPTASRSMNFVATIQHTIVKHYFAKIQRRYKWEIHILQISLYISCDIKALMTGICLSSPFPLYFPIYIDNILPARYRLLQLQCSKNQLFYHWRTAKLLSEQCFADKENGDLNQWFSDFSPQDP